MNTNGVVRLEKRTNKVVTSNEALLLASVGKERVAGRKVNSGSSRTTIDLRLHKVGENDQQQLLHRRLSSRRRVRGLFAYTLVALMLINPSLVAALTEDASTEAAPVTIEDSAPEPAIKTTPETPQGLEDVYIAEEVTAPEVVEENIETAPTQESTVDEEGAIEAKNTADETVADKDVTAADTSTGTTSDDAETSGAKAQAEASVNSDTTDTVEDTTNTTDTASTTDDVDDDMTNTSVDDSATTTDSGVGEDIFDANTASTTDDGTDTTQDSDTASTTGAVDTDVNDDTASTTDATGGGSDNDNASTTDATNTGQDQATASTTDATGGGSDNDNASTTDATSDTGGNDTASTTIDSTDDITADTNTSGGGGVSSTDTTDFDATITDSTDTGDDAQNNGNDDTLTTDINDSASDTDVAADNVEQKSADVKTVDEATLRAEIEAEIEQIVVERLQKEYEEQLLAELAAQQAESETQTNFQSEHEFSDADCELLSDNEIYCRRGEVAVDDTSSVFTGVFEGEGINDEEIILQIGGVVRQITDNDYSDINPVHDEVSGKVVWQALIDGRWQVFIYDVDTAQTAQISGGGFNNINPYTFGNVVVWQGWVGNNWEIFYSEVAIEGDALQWLTTQVTDNDWPDIDPQVAEGIILWEALINNSWQVFSYDVYTDNLVQVSQGDGDNRNPRLMLVYESEDDMATQLVGYDVATQKHEIISDGANTNTPVEDLPESPLDDSQATMPAEGASSSTRVNSKEGAE